jgi:hypothetical protein
METNNTAIYDQWILQEYGKSREHLSRQGEVLCQYAGNINQNMVVSISYMLENQLEQKGVGRSRISRLGYAIIECLQNIMFHASRNDDGFNQAFIIIANTSKGYSIQTGNLVHGSLLENIKKIVAHINDTKKSALEKEYYQLLEQGNVSQEGRGGIGLISLAMKKNHEMKFNLIENNTDHFMFIITLEMLY